MKPIRIFWEFLFGFLLIFMLDCVFHFDLFKSDKTFIKQLFSSIFQGLNMSLLFTFLYSFRRIKEIEVYEEFKVQRKNLLIYLFIVSFIFNVVIMVSKHLVLGHEVKWIKEILFSLLWAVILLLLALLFSGALRKRKLNH